MLERARRDLGEVVVRDRRIADARDRLEERLLTLAAAVRPREEYAVVHGELGPSHVCVDARGNPVIIDIEGLMYFDVEWEHVHLRIRLHGRYRPLAVDGLDEDRLALYMLAQRLSLTAGPLRLLDGDFPGRRPRRTRRTSGAALAGLVAVDRPAQRQTQGCITIFPTCPLRESSCCA